jgi:hypothetical protein
MGDDEVLEQKNTDRKRLWLDICRIIVSFWNKMRMCDREEKRRRELKGGYIPVQVKVYPTQGWEVETEE